MDQWYLPILIPLRKVSCFLVDNINSEENLLIEAFRKNVLPSDIRSEFPTSYVLHMLQDKKCLFLLDGLDEVSDDSQFQAVIKEIRGLTSRFPGNKIILTSRYSGWRGGVGSNFKQFEIKKLDDLQIQEFIDSWYRAIEHNRYSISRSVESDAEKLHRRRIAEEKARNLKAALNEVKSIRMLAENPLLLSIICFVHYHKTLPKERQRLYQDCSDLLLVQWDKEKGLQVDDTNLILKHKNAIMQEIAFALHCGKIGGNFGRKEATAEEIIPIVEGMLIKFQMDNTQAAELFQKLVDRSGIIVPVERYSNKYSFSHLTFQEYYTAKFLYENQLDIFDYVGEQPRGHELTGWWREVLLLYSSMHKNPSNIISKLCHYDEKDILNQKLRIAAQCTSESFEKPSKDVVDYIVSALLSIRTDNNATINSFPAEIKNYLFEFTMRPEFYSISLRNAASRIQNEDEALALSIYLLDLLNSVDLEMRLASLRTLTKIYQKYDILNKEKRDYILKFLSDDAKDIQLVALNLIKILPIALLEKNFVVEVIKSILKIYKMNYTSPYGSISASNDFMLNKMLEEYINYVPFDSRKEIRDELKWFIIQFIAANKSSYDEFKDGLFFDEKFIEIKRIQTIFKCLIKLNETHATAYKMELQDALDRGLPKQQANAIILLASSFGSDDDVIEGIIDKLQSPFGQVRSTATFSLYFLKLNDHIIKLTMLLILHANR